MDRLCVVVVRLWAVDRSIVVAPPPPRDCPQVRTTSIHSKVGGAWEAEHVDDLETQRRLLSQQIDLIDVSRRSTRERTPRRGDSAAKRGAGRGETRTADCAPAESVTSRETRRSSRDAIVCRTALATSVRRSHTSNRIAFLVFPPPAFQAIARSP